MRYAIAAAFLVWLLGNIPAWILLPTYTSHNDDPPHQVSYALYWTLGILIVPACAALAGVLGFMLREFAHWVIGERETAETREQRIERLERELGIGQK